MTSEPPIAADARRSAPAAERNREPLTAALATLVPPAARVLEVASGTGQHAAHWAGRFPGWHLQPTDAEAFSLESIAAWSEAAGVPNLAAPRRLDVTDRSWPGQFAGPWQAIVAVNLIHIAPWSAACGLLAGAARLLASDGRLILYGPFAENGVLEPESNRSFDAWLRSEDSRWGVRDLADIDAVARTEGLARVTSLDLPANNRVIVYALIDDARPAEGASCA
ncbi:MAG: DUF938 domain-containing protein [Pseudomonadota bacterium]